MRTKTIIKRFIFEEKNREKITLGTGARLHPQENDLRLQISSVGYPTIADIYAKTWVFNPKSVVSWLGFDVYVTHEEDYTSTPYTSLGFRLGNDIDEYFWNGAAWEINVVDWNTEEEIAENISSFPVASQKLQIVINLKSEDTTKTPLIQEIRVSYQSNVDLQDDLIFNSIVPAFRNINPLSDFIITMTATTDTIDLDDFPLETPYEIVDIDSCFNYTDDSDKLIDIFSSYDSGTNIITLSEVVDIDKRVWIKFIYQPAVSVSTDQEYVEVSKIPAIHILRYDTTKNYPALEYTAVRNKNGTTGIKATKVRQKTFEFTVATVSGSAIDQQRLQDEVRKFFADNSFINFSGLDEDYTMFISDDFSMSSSINNLATYSGVFRFVVMNVVFFMKTQDVYTVEKLNITGDLDVVIE